MIKSIKIFCLLLLLMTSTTSNSRDYSYKKAIEYIKSLYNKLMQKETLKTVKYDLGDISETIPYKLYLIIQELKYNQGGVLLLNRLALYGPPGNGKSTYARKLAQAIDATFKEISGPSIVNSFQGSGAENVNKIFDEAIEEQRLTGKNVLIFIDEVDSIASKDAKRLDNKAAVQALWLNLDKIKNNPFIFIVIATNDFKNMHPTLIDRFGDNILEIENPDEKMRKEVIEFFIKRFDLNPEKLKTNDFAKRTKGLSIRSIEDSLRSIKRISNIENGGEPNDQIIDAVLRTNKKKPVSSDLDANLEKIQKYFNLVNSAGGVLTIVVNFMALYSYIKQAKPTPIGLNQLNIPAGVQG